MVLQEEVMMLLDQEWKIGNNIKIINMKNKEFKVQELVFDSFKMGNLIHLKGGISGKVTGSRLYQGETYVDINWEDGNTSCDYHLAGAGDGSSDNFVGGTVNP